MKLEEDMNKSIQLSLMTNDIALPGKGIFIKRVHVGVCVYVIPGKDLTDSFIWIMAHCS